MKHLYQSFSIIFLCFIFTGCGKQICSYCGETKFCEEYKILDSTRYICEDCINNPQSSISSNVVSEYSAAPLDKSFFGVGAAINNQDTVSDNSTSDNNSDNTSGNTSDNASNSNSQLDSLNNNENNSDNNDNDASNNNNINKNKSQNNSSSNSNSTVNNAIDNNSNATDNNSNATDNNSINSIVNRLASLLAQSNLQLSPDENTSKNYYIYDSNGNNCNITLNFTETSSGKTALNICGKSCADSSAFTNTCINASLAFINSNDYSQTGYSIYNNACNYGNYTTNGCRFYFMEDSESSDEAFLYDISYQ